MNAPASPGSAALQPRRVLGGESLALLLLGGWLGLHIGDLILTWRADGAAAVLASTAIGPLELLVLWLAFGMVWRGVDSAGQRFTPWAALAFGLSMLLPSGLLAALLLIGFGSIVAFEARGPARWGAIGLAGLGANLLWLRFGQAALGGPVIDAEALATSTILSLLEPGILRDGNLLRMPSGHGVVILPGCSLAQTLPLALLAFLLIRHRDGATQSLWPAMAGLTLALAAVNLLRLCLLAWSPAGYAWGHGVIGANLFGLAGVLLTQLIAERHSTDG